MNKPLLAKISTIVARLDAPAQAETWRIIEHIQSQGGQSFRAILRLLEKPDTDLEIRKTMCWLVGCLGNKQATPTLLNVLDSGDSALRICAALALADLGPKTAISKLLDVLAHDEDTTARAIAAHALGRIGDRASADALLQHAADSGEAPRVRGEALEALTNYPELAAKIIPVLLTTLHDAEPEVRFWAVFALGQLGNEHAIPELENIAATDHATIPGWWAISQEATDSINSIRARHQLPLSDPQ